MTLLNKDTNNTSGDPSFSLDNRDTLSLTNKTINGLIWMIAGKGVQVVIRIFILAVLARLVLPEEFGLIGVAMVVLGFSQLFIHMGVGPAIVQKKELDERHITTGLTLSLLMGFFFALLLVISAPLIAKFFRMEELVTILRVISIIFFIDALTLIAQALLQRNFRFKWLATFEAVSYIFGYGVVAIILAYKGLGVWALLWAHLTQAFVKAILFVSIQRLPKRLGFNKSAFKELIYFGGGMTLARICNFFAGQGDNIIIGRMLGASALGIYGRAYKFMVMPVSLFGSALDRTLFPAMAKVQDNKERLGKAYVTGVSAIASFALPLSVFVFLMANEIVMVVLGPIWTDVIIPLKILSIGLLFRMSYKISDSLARATGKVYNRAWRQLIFAFMVIMGAWVGQHWGLKGVAVGVVFALFCNFFLMAGLSLSIIKLPWPVFFQSHFKGLFSGLVTGFLTYFFLNFFRYSLSSHLLILILTSLMLAISNTVLIKFIPKYFFNNDIKELFLKFIKRK